MQHDLQQIEWKFKAYAEDDTKNQPQHLQFFSGAEIDDAVNALIREDIQNHLDAGASDEPVKVCYKIPSQGLDPKIAKSWFGTLLPHLNAPEVLQESNTVRHDLKSELKYLVIEDFYTTGLAGDPAQTLDPDPNKPRNDFFWFVRNVGRSGKKKGNKGRWGLGKIVYPGASLMRSFLAWSVSEDSPSQGNLIGRSVLPIHKIDQIEYQTEGYAGVFPREDLPNLAMPEQEPSVISRFKNDFGLRREFGEKGLSLVVPLPSSSVTSKGILQSVVEHWFWEILAGKLVVKFEGTHDYEIAQESLTDFVESWSGFDDDQKAEIRRKIEFCEKADKMSLKSASYFELKRPYGYKWRGISNFFGSVETAESAKSLFHEGELLAFEIPVEIEEYQNFGSPEETSFMVYIQKEGTLKQPSETFIRNGLTIIGIKETREPGVRALVVAEEEKISGFLGDSENPSHTRWDRNTPHFKNKYKKGNEILTFIRISAARLSSFLAKRDDKRMEDLLAEYFSIPDDEAKEVKWKNRGKKKRIKPVVVPTKPKLNYISLSKNADGFRISAHPDSKEPPEKIKLRVAYEVISGNAFKQWHPSDFQIGKNGSSLELVGCRLLRQNHALSEFQIDDSNFSIQASGFDTTRDLIVDAKPIRQEKEADHDT